MLKTVSLFAAFATLLPWTAMAQVSPSPASGETTGVEGVITVSPVRGGPVRVGESSSSPLADVAFEVKQGSRVVTSFQTDEHGHFQVLLEPGNYTVSRKDYASAIGSYGPFEVKVTAGKMASVRWDCDSGMR